MMAELTPLEIQVEQEARKLIQFTSALADLSSGLTKEQMRAVGDRLRPEMDAVESKLETLFPEDFD